MGQRIGSYKKMKWRKKPKQYKE